MSEKYSFIDAEKAHYPFAKTYLSEHGTLPTVRTLMATAEVSRGTSAAALQDIRR